MIAVTDTWDHAARSDSYRRLANIAQGIDMGSAAEAGNAAGPTRTGAPSSPNPLPISPIELSGRKAWAICPLTENCVVRIAGHARYSNFPGAPAAVAEMSTEFLMASSCWFAVHVAVSCNAT